VAFSETRTNRGLRGPIIGADLVDPEMELVDLDLERIRTLKLLAGDYRLT
jgi:hypothetical protein